jgi:uncharacterized protein (TIRG00374 family)
MAKTADTRHQRTTAWAQRLLGFAVLAAAVYLVHRLVSEVGWDEVVQRLGEARLPWVAAVAACLVAQLATWAARQRLAVRRISSTPPGWTLFLALVATAAANFLLPFARLLGGLLRARFMSRSSSPRIPKRVYYGAVLFDQVVHFLIMGTLTLVGLVLGADELGRPVAAAYIALGIVALAAVAGIWLHRRTGATGGGLVRFLERRTAEREGIVGRFLASSETAAKIFFRLAADGVLWRRAGALGLGVFAFVAGAQWLTFHALGVSVNPLWIVTTVSAGLSAGVLLGTPGGLGTTEATMIALYHAFGIGTVDAASAVLLFRGLQFAVVLGTGLPSMLVLELYAIAVRRRNRQKVEPEEAVTAVERSEPLQPVEKASG